MLNLPVLTLVYCRPRPLVFTFGRRQDRLHPGREAAVEISAFETRRNLFVNDSFAQCVRQYSFQTVAHFHKHGVILHKYKKHRAVVLAFLPHFPSAGHPHSIILNRRGRLHLRKNRHQDLLGGLPLKVFQRPVQLRRCRGGSHLGVIIEILCWSWRNHFLRKRPEAKRHQQNSPEMFHNQGLLVVDPLKSN